MSCSSLVLIRHATTAWNRRGRYQGHSDPPLIAQGRRQAARLCRATAGLDLAAVWSSDLRRAVETAAPLAAAHGLPVRQDARLRELNFGAWEGYSPAEVLARDKAAWEAWWEDPVYRAPPGGERVLDLWRRVTAGLAQVTGQTTGTVAVVTHGGPLRLVLTGLVRGDRKSVV